MAAWAPEARSARSPPARIAMPTMRHARMPILLLLSRPADPTPPWRRVVPSPKLPGEGALRRPLRRRRDWTAACHAGGRPGLQELIDQDRQHDDRPLGDELIEGAD